MTDREFYKYRQSVIAFLNIALNGELHTWALWEQIAKQLELLWDNIGNRSGADLDFISLYSDNLESIRHKMQETYECCGNDKNDCGKRINSAIGGLVERLKLSSATTTQPKPLEKSKWHWVKSNVAKQLYKAYEKDGYLKTDKDGMPSEWLKTNEDCAVFVRCMNELKPKSKRKSPSDKREFDWKPFEIMFGKKQLCRTYCDSGINYKDTNIYTIFHKNSK